MQASPAIWTLCVAAFIPLACGRPPAASATNTGSAGSSEESSTGSTSADTSTTQDPSTSNGTEADSDTETFSESESGDESGGLPEGHCVAEFGDTPSTWNEGHGIDAAEDGHFVVAARLLRDGERHFGALGFGPDCEAQWEYDWRPPDADWADALAITFRDDGSCVVVGQAYSDLAVHTGLAAALSPTGELLWQRRYDGNPEGHDIDFRGVAAVPNSSDVLIAGRGADDWGEHPFAVALRIDSTGQVSWQYEMPLQNEEEGSHFKDVAIAPQGAVFVGQHRATIEYEPLLTYIDFDGQVLWSLTRPLGGVMTQSAAAYDVVVANGQIYLLAAKFVAPKDPLILTFDLEGQELSSDYVPPPEVGYPREPAGLAMSPAGLAIGTRLDLDWAPMWVTGIDPDFPSFSYAHLGAEATQLHNITVFGDTLYFTGQTDYEGSAGFPSFGIVGRVAQQFP
jgi:hypothetical protein